MTSRILIVDRDIRWLEYVSCDLNEFEIIVVQDTNTTLSELTKFEFDLVIAGSNCISVIKAVLEKRPNQRFVIATSQPSTQEALDVYRLGAIRYFSKSFSSNDLSNHVKKAIFTAE